MKGSVKKIAHVLSHNEDNLLVRMPVNEETDGCGGCKNCQFCGSEKNKFIDVIIPLSNTKVVPPVGAEVMIEYRRRDPGLAAVLFFTPPLFGLLGGGFLVRWAGAESDIHFLAGAGAFFLAGIGVSWVLSRIFPSLIRPEARLVTIVN